MVKVDLLCSEAGSMEERREGGGSDMGSGGSRFATPPTVWGAGRETVAVRMEGEDDSPAVVGGSGPLVETTLSGVVVSGTAWARVAVCGRPPPPLLATGWGSVPLGTTEWGREPLGTTEWGREPLGTTECGTEPLGTTECGREPLGTTECGREPPAEREETVEVWAIGWGRPGGASSFFTLPP